MRLGLRWQAARKKQASAIHIAVLIRCDFERRLAAAGAVAFIVLFRLWFFMIGTGNAGFGQCRIFVDGAG